MKLATGLGDLWNWYSYAEKTVAVLERLRECGFRHVDMNFACWDIGHAHMQGVCQYEEIRKLGEHLKVVHIHDNNGREDSHRFPYMGTVSMDEIIHALQDIRFDGCFTMEISSGIRFPGTKRKDFQGDGRLLNPPLEYGMKMEEALYACGKHILNQYNCFEE